MSQVLEACDNQLFERLTETMQIRKKPNVYTGPRDLL